MALPEPQAGLVIHYSFLWRREADSGQGEGRKDRPCVIILSVRDVDGRKVVTVAPITHSRPASGDGIELLPQLKSRLGLDDQPSWVLSNEVNKFVWPGSDVRPISRRRPLKYSYGLVPANLVRKLIDQIVARRRVNLVERD